MSHVFFLFIFPPLYSPPPIPHTATQACCVTVIHVPMKHSGPWAVCSHIDLMKHKISDFPRCWSYSINHASLILFKYIANRKITQVRGLKVYEHKAPSESKQLYPPQKITIIIHNSRIYVIAIISVMILVVAILNFLFKSYICLSLWTF